MDTKQRKFIQIKINWTYTLIYRHDFRFADPNLDLDLNKDSRHKSRLTDTNPDFFKIQIFRHKSTVTDSDPDFLTQIKEN